ncbi:hypothetical protein GpartN1_g2717.t1 [Galdieria partita]|uniref:C3H1-type domain-containing protein n=1 Tax=Galdieria partita TaxID=83374 RepID=A0A9C7PV18_9RHOD|nr:hypothetical protein GpartN1_g2717.t1 [Galdieria partita]
MVVCKYFLRGNCKFGRNCKNEHPLQNASQGSFGFSKKGPGEWNDPFQTRTSPSSFSNSFGNYKRNDFGQGVSSEPFRSFTKPSGNGFYRPQRSVVAMDVSGSNEDARGRGRVSYHRGRGRANYPENTLQRSGNWTKEAESDAMEVSWPFTCYGLEGNPNIFEGDISFEELRAEAYAAALQGIGLNEIVQRERDLAAEYRNRQSTLFSNSASRNTTTTGTNPKDPFGRTTSVNSNSHPFQAANTFGSNMNNQGGMSIFSAPHSSQNNGYSTMFQDFPQRNENANMSSQTEQFSHFANTTEQMKQQTLPESTHEITVNIDSSLEQNDTKLSQEDMQHYRASLFQLGNVPERAPSKELVEL